MFLLSSDFRLVGKGHHRICELISIQAELEPTSYDLLNDDKAKAIYYYIMFKFVKA